jgi:hypothetical protein
MGKGSHKGSVRLHHSFDEINNYLIQNGTCELETATGKNFKANASETCDGRKEILFYQNDDEIFGRCYSCCWGHYNNCGGTWIGMYCRALDRHCLKIQ